MQSRELKAERVRAGYTQAAMARELGVSPGVYCRKENGRRAFSDAEKAKVMELLALTPEMMVEIFLR